jgi:DNA-binding NarL/FixJ family response regulator
MTTRHLRTHLAGGFWLTLRAARLSSGHKPGAPAGHGGTIAVTIEEASAADRPDLLGLLATGSDTRAMARQMSLSEHTVQDHLKSIFAKTGAHDRVTILSRALGTRR